MEFERVLIFHKQLTGLNKDQKKVEKPSQGTVLVQKAVEKLSLSETTDKTPPVKVKRKFNVVDEYNKSKSKRKENSNLVVIGMYQVNGTSPNVLTLILGHVDAGKSTLMGRLLYDTGVVDERTMQKYKQEAEKIGKSSFALAWVLDQTGEERSRFVMCRICE